MRLHSTEALIFILFFLLAIQSECSNSIPVVRRALTSGIRRNFSADGTKRINNGFKRIGVSITASPFAKMAAMSQLYAGQNNNELIRAIELRDMKQIVSLIKSGANLNARDSDGVTPLERTLQLREHNMFLTLTFSGANLKDLDSLGRGYIHTSIAHGQLTAARFLIAQGVTITEPNSFFQAMVDAARLKDGVKKAVLLPLLLDLYLMSECDWSVLNDVIHHCQLQAYAHADALKFLKQLMNNHTLEFMCNKVTYFDYNAIINNEPLIF